MRKINHPWVQIYVFIHRNQMGSEGPSVLRWQASQTQRSHATMWHSAEISKLLWHHFLAHTFLFLSRRRPSPVNAAFKTDQGKVVVLVFTFGCCKSFVELFLPALNQNVLIFSFVSVVRLSLTRLVLMFCIWNDWLFLKEQVRFSFMFQYNPFLLRFLSLKVQFCQ